jgi:hypothetical protein
MSPAGSKRIEIQLNRMYDTERLATRFQVTIDSRHLVCLLPQLDFIDAAGDFQSFGMISDRDVFVFASNCGLGHILN